MTYITGTIADVVYGDPLATLILDTGHRHHHLPGDAQLLAQALKALFGDDGVGKLVAVQYDGTQLTSIEIPGVAPDYAI